jgi:hypothetical protein
MGRGMASMATYGRRGAQASVPMAARRCTGQRLGGTRVAPAYCLDHHTRTLPQCETPRTDRRSEAGLGVRAPGGGSARRDDIARDVARVVR